MAFQKINPLNSIFTVNGKIFWNDKRRRIDLKKPIIDIIEPLEAKHLILYRMELCLNKDKLLKRAEELSEDGVIPILLYFTKKDCGG